MRVRIRPAVTAAAAAATVFVALIAAPHAGPPEPPSPDVTLAVPAPLSAPHAPAHNPDPAVIGPLQERSPGG
jgi:hypothetical protein